MVGDCYPQPWFPLLDDSSRCSCRTTTNCRLYRSFLLGYRFGRSGSSGFVVDFRRLRWSNCVPAPRGRSCWDRCRYRYICRLIGLLVVNGCRPKRSEFPLRGRLKWFEFKLFAKFAF